MYPIAFSWIVATPSQLCRNSIAQLVATQLPSCRNSIAQLVATQLPSHCPAIAQSLPSLSQLNCPAIAQSLPSLSQLNCPAIAQSLPQRVGHLPQVRLVTALILDPRSLKIFSVSKKNWVFGIPKSRVRPLTSCTPTLPQWTQWQLTGGYRPADIQSTTWIWGLQICRTFSHRRKTTVRLLLASSPPTLAICQSSPHGYVPFSSTGVARFVSRPVFFSTCPTAGITGSFCTFTALCMPSLTDRRSTGFISAS
jgi:hypothetical protein